MPKELNYEPEESVERSLARTDSKIVPFSRNASDEPVSLRDSTFTALGTKRVSSKQEKILSAPPNPQTEVAIKPTGECYPPQIAMRRRLAKAFGPMGWALRPISPTTPPADKATMYREYALIAEGRVIATAFGSGKYYESNARMDYGDTAEAIKSDALKRCCKDLNMLSELWDPLWVRSWRNEYAVHVFVAEKNRKTQKVETVDRWRRIDAEPFPGEIEPVRDSPNQDEWRKQSAAWRAMLDQEAELTRAEAAKLKTAKHGLANARHDLEAQGGNPRAARVPDPPPPPPATEPAAEIKPEATQRGSRPHTPHGVRTEDKPFLIKTCKIVVKKTANGSTLYAIEMMDGQSYFTFSSRIYDEMNRHWAQRDRLLIQHETKRVNNETWRMIVEWQVKE
jgi:hypothetical protein